MPAQLPRVLLVQVEGCCQRSAREAFGQETRSISGPPSKLHRTTTWTSPPRHGVCCDRMAILNQDTGVLAGNRVGQFQRDEALWGQVRFADDAQSRLLRGPKSRVRSSPTFPRGVRGRHGLTLARECACDADIVYQPRRRAARALTAMSMATEAEVRSRNEG